MIWAMFAAILGLQLLIAAWVRRAPSLSRDDLRVEVDRLGARLDVLSAMVAAARGESVRSASASQELSGRLQALEGVLLKAIEENPEVSQWTQGQAQVRRLAVVRDALRDLEERSRVAAGIEG